MENTDFEFFVIRLSRKVVYQDEPERIEYEKPKYFALPVPVDHPYQAKHYITEKNAEEQAKLWRGINYKAEVLKYLAKVVE